MNFTFHINHKYFYRVSISQYFMGHTYTKKTSTVYLKCKSNLVFYVFIS